ncbi:RNA polymerase sigma factor [Microbacterium lushaniae]|uniref:RNA polymerase sigma factor n=1 Tax=Microbacterium lushaniae TaxID=2614639 RepID=UPI00193110E7|nr:sigma-70 family RNA polymerase sigma factor [Microbacterium lushaniae]
MSTDSSVIQRSVREPAVFGELFHRHASRLHRYVARRAGDTVADDVISETFLIAFERRARFDLSHEDARPWLFGIATNLIHRHRIAEARTLRTAERFVADSPAVSDPERMDEQVAAHLEMKRVAKVLRRLPIGDRDCLLLYAWEDLSYEQIAEAMSIPTGTVRSRLNRARRALRAEPLIEEGTHERAHYAPDPA